MINTVYKSKLDRLTPRVSSDCHATSANQLPSASGVKKTFLGFISTGSNPSSSMARMAG